MDVKCHFQTLNFDSLCVQFSLICFVLQRKSPIEKAVACCLDGSARSFAALDQLLRFMRATEHEIVILHVVPGSSNDPSSHTAQIVKWAKQMVSSAPEMSKADIRFETIECEEPRCAHLQDQSIARVMFSSVLFGFVRWYSGASISS